VVFGLFFHLAPPDPFFPPGDVCLEFPLFFFTPLGGRLGRLRPLKCSQKGYLQRPSLRFCLVFPFLTIQLAEVSAVSYAPSRLNLYPATRIPPIGFRFFPSGTIVSPFRNFHFSREYYSSFLTRRPHFTSHRRLPLFFSIPLADMIF